MMEKKEVNVIYGVNNRGPVKKIIVEDPDDIWEQVFDEFDVDDGDFPIRLDPPSAPHTVGVFTKRNTIHVLVTKEQVRFTSVARLKHGLGNSIRTIQDVYPASIATLGKWGVAPVLLVDGLLRVLGELDVHWGPLSALRTSKSTFVETATQFSFSLTAFLLTGLAVIAAISALRDTEDHDTNRDTSSGPEEEEEPPDPPTDNNEPDAVGPLAQSFRNGTYLTLSAALLGIVYQSIYQGLQGINQSNFAVEAVTFGLYYVVFYVFLIILLGMVLTSKDIVELILEMATIESHN